MHVHNPLSEHAYDTLKCDTWTVAVTRDTE